MQIKEATPSDYNTLVEFWNQNSGWDQISRKVWEDRFINAPYGPSVIFFIEKNNKILAKLVFVLLKVNLGNKEYNGCRPFAAVVDKSVKGIFGIKYVGQLINHGFKAMRKKGTDLLIMLPDPRWKRLFRFIDIVFCDFPLYKLPIDNQNIASDYDKVSTEFIDFDTIGINELWNKVKKQNIYMISRNQQILKWKNSHRDYKLVGVYQETNLIGIATFLEKSQENQIQICDVLIPDTKYQKLVFNQVSSFINKEYCGNPDFKKMVILVPELFKESLIDVGYKPDDYQFLFVIKRLNKKIPKKALNISNWYLSAND
jgi:hypothetical protein